LFFDDNLIFKTNPNSTILFFKEFHETQARNILFSALLLKSNPKKTLMAKVGTYFNFPRNTEEAFNFYNLVFGGEFCRGGIAQFRDIPAAEGMPLIAEEDLNLVMHVELPILDGHLLMGIDTPESMGFNVKSGNNVSINLEPDTQDGTERLLEVLASERTNIQELQDMFWGACYGSCTNKFGAQLMLN
jgi:PhnB protein